MKARKHLSADGLFKMIKQEFKKVKDHRSADITIPLDDALMSGFALFSLIGLLTKLLDIRRLANKQNCSNTSV